MVYYLRLFNFRGKRTELRLKNFKQGTETYSDWNRVKKTGISVVLT